MSENSKTEGQRIVSAMANALFVIMLFVAIGLFFGILEIFINIVSLTGFALLALLFYAVR